MCVYISLCIYICVYMYVSVLQCNDTPAWAARSHSEVPTTMCMQRWINISTNRCIAVT